MLKARQIQLCKQEKAETISNKRKDNFKHDEQPDIETITEQKDKDQ
jgi:hypothetical protein